MLKKRLLEVQEASRIVSLGLTVLLPARVHAASIARLQSLVEKYPLYSHADEALYLAWTELRRADRAHPQEPNLRCA
jgi:hypothetical protein